MKRDFSEAHRQQLLSAFKGVEKENLTDYKSWVGTNHSFSRWINILDLDYYLRNIDYYHRNVQHMSDTAQRSIIHVFDNEQEFDHGKRSQLEEIKHQYIVLRHYLQKLSDVMDVRSTPFSYVKAKNLDIDTTPIITREPLFVVNTDGSIDLNLEKIEELFVKPQLTDEDCEMLIGLLALLSSNDVNKPLLKILIDAGFNEEKQKQLTEYMKKIAANGTGGTAVSLLDESGMENLIAAIRAALNNQNIMDGSQILLTIAQMFKNVLKITDANRNSAIIALLALLTQTDFIGMESIKFGWNFFASDQVEPSSKIEVVSKVYEWALSQLKVDNQFNFDSRFGKILPGLGIAADSAGIIKDAKNIIDILGDPNSSNGEKWAALWSYTNDSAGLLGDIYSFFQIKNIHPSGAGKINQILSVREYGFPAGTAAAIDKVNTGMIIFQIGGSTVIGGIRGAETALADGFQVKDVGEIGLEASLTGLSTTVDIATLGLIKWDGHKVAEDWKAEADSRIHDDNNVIFKKVRENIEQGKDISAFGWSMVAGLQVMGDKMIDGGRAVVTTVAKWFK